MNMLYYEAQSETTVGVTFFEYEYSKKVTPTVVSLFSNMNMLYYEAQSKNSNILKKKCNQY